jgi:hypothetical protein
LLDSLFQESLFLPSQWIVHLRHNLLKLKTSKERKEKPFNLATRANTKVAGLHEYLGWTVTKSAKIAPLREFHDMFF